MPTIGIVVFAQPSHPLKFEDHDLTLPSYLSYFKKKEEIYSNKIDYRLKLYNFLIYM